MEPILTIIGAGHMGGAFYRGLVRAGFGVQLRICDRNTEKLHALHAPHAYTDAAEAIAGASVVLLAVKPRSAQELLASLRPALSNTLIISIMAGISLKTLQESTECSAVVRAMPNLPVCLGLGLTGWVTTEGVSAEQRAFAAQLFSSVGEQFELTDEKMMDALTPLSGSGPAYFFLLSELLATKAVQEGFSSAQAALIARQTLIGSAGILASDTRTPSQGCEAVAGKGGTTEVALRFLKENQFDNIFFAAIDRAIARSLELKRTTTQESLSELENKCSD